VKIGEKMEDYNPYLEQAITEIVQKQIDDNNSPETRKTLSRLLNEGFSEEEAKKLIGSAVVIEIYEILKNEKEFNLGRFIRNLDNLPNISDDK